MIDLEILDITEIQAVIISLVGIIIIGPYMMAFAEVPSGKVIYGLHWPALYFLCCWPMATA